MKEKEYLQILVATPIIMFIAVLFGMLGLYLVTIALGLTSGFLLILVYCESNRIEKRDQHGKVNT